MKINEVTITNAQALYESIDATNDTGFLTEDLVKVVKAEDGAWSKPVSGDQMMSILESWIK